MANVWLIKSNLITSSNTLFYKRLISYYTWDKKKKEIYLYTLIWNDFFFWNGNFAIAYIVS